MMLYLVQHAKAKSEDEDPERPLTEEGWNEIKKVADFIKENTNIKVANIYHSGKTRAKQTAEVLGEHLEPTNGVQEAEGLKPMAEPSIWLKRLDEITGNTILVGHLPHLNKLASRLLGQYDEKKMVDFQNAGIVCLVRDDMGLWSVLWVIIPELLT